MTGIPDRPKIFHITHSSNLPIIIDQGALWSDAKRLAQQLDIKIVGMPTIKQRRLVELDVGCHPGTKVGEYVPFYFCPRSIMLYILHQGNHPDLDYSEGQEPIIHFQAVFHKAITWADTEKVRWAFTKSNAGARYCDFFGSVDRLNEVNWDAIRATDFRSSTVKEGKQAEFLIFDAFPWELVERIGVITKKMHDKIAAFVAGAVHQPPVSVEQSWYY